MGKLADYAAKAGYELLSLVMGTLFILTVVLLIGSIIGLIAIFFGAIAALLGILAASIIGLSPVITVLFVALIVLDSMADDSIFED